MSQVRTCTHIKDDGTPCQAIPVHNTPYCYFHRKYYHPPALPGDKNYQAPLLESHQSIQLALTHLYQAFLSKKMDMKEAQFGLQVLRLAAKAITEVEKTVARKKTEEERVYDHRSLAEILLAPEDEDEDDDDDSQVHASVPPQPRRGTWDPYGCMPKNGSVGRLRT